MDYLTLLKGESEVNLLAFYVIVFLLFASVVLIVELVNKKNFFKRKYLRYKKINDQLCNSVHDYHKNNPIFMEVNKKLDDYEKLIDDSEIEDRGNGGKS